MEYTGRFPLPAVLVIALVATGIFASRQQIRSHRPVGMHDLAPVVTGLEKVPSRLWEDPFRHLIESQSMLANPGKKAHSGSRHTRLTDLVKSVETHSEEGRVLILPVLLPGIGFEESKEQRRRSRYAIVSGLSTSGFSPTHNGRIGSLLDTRSLDMSSKVGAPAAGNPPEDHSAGKGEAKPEMQGVQPDIIPYPASFEWFGRMAIKDTDGLAYRSVLVLWLDTTTFFTESPPFTVSGMEGPLVMLLKALVKHEGVRIVPNPGLGKENVEALPGDATGGIASVSPQVPEGQEHEDHACNVSIVILGPPNSDSLKSLVNYKHVATGEDKSECQFKPELLRLHKEHGLIFIVPTATIGHAVIDDASQSSGALFRVFNHVDSKDEYTCSKRVPIHRCTIGDDHLMKGIVDELERRGLVLGNSNSGEHVAMICEWDTSYGRSVSGSFLRAVKDGEGDSTTWFKSFHYLRGLDGRGIATSTGLGKILGHVNSERPNGTSRYDYIQRLVNSMKTGLSDGGQYRAIGVVGTDLFDKQIVIQALRAEFPNAILFTTDLDVRLAVPEDYDWTRNLIIASTFGLSLKSSLQAAIPPFRDSYQTSRYLATLLATGHQDIKKLVLPSSPRMYEVARSGFVDITPYEDGASTGDKGPSSVHPVFSAIGYESMAESCLAILAALLIVAYMLRRNLKKFLSSAIGGLSDSLKGHDLRSTGWRTWGKIGLVPILLSLLYLVCSKVTGDVTSNRGEPFSWFEGISVWPSVIIRCMAIALAVNFFYRIGGLVNQTHDRLRRGWGLGGIGVDGSAAEQLQVEGSKDPSDGTRGDSNHPEPTKVRIATLWSRYLRRTERAYSKGIVGGLLLLAFGLSVLWATHYPTSPARGEVARFVDQGTALAAVAVSLCLCGYVIELLRNALSMVNSMKCPDVVWPGVASGGTTALDVARGEQREVEFLSELTGPISRVILYPFILLLLLACSAHPMFDRWDVTPAVVVLATLYSLVMIAVTMTMRAGLESTRKHSIQEIDIRLRSERMKAADGVKTDSIKRTEEILESIKNYQQGAFASITRNPIIQAISIPAGGLGGLAVLDSFTRMM